MASASALAADVGPVMATQILSIDEARKADVDINNRLKVEATFSVIPSITAIQGAQGTSTSPWFVNLRNAAGTEIGTSGAPVRTDPTGTTPQSASQSGTWNITNVSGTISLPTGAATAANQTTQLTSLQLLDDAVNAVNTPLSKAVPVAGQLDDTSTTAATEDNVASARITAQRGLHTNLRNASGSEIGISSAPVRVDPTGTTTQPTSAPGFLSTVNSSATPLGAAGVFTGTAEDTINYGMVTVSVFANVASAASGLSVQWSSDGTNWDSTDSFTVASSTGKSFTFGPAARFLRVIYTNGAGAQASFRLQTVLRQVFVKASSHKIDETVPAESDSELMSAVLRTKSPLTGNYDSTSSTNPVPIRDTLRTGAVYGNLSVGMTGTEVRVGGSRLVGRRLVSVTPVDADMYWCLEATCSNCTTANGMPIFRSQMVSWGIDDTASLCIVSPTTSKNARITEAP